MVQATKSRKLNNRDGSIREVEPQLGCLDNALASFQAESYVFTRPGFSPALTLTEVTLTTVLDRELVDSLLIEFARLEVARTLRGVNKLSDEILAEQTHRLQEAITAMPLVDLDMLKKELATSLKGVY